MKRYFFTLGISSIVILMLIMQPTKATCLESDQFYDKRAASNKLMIHEEAGQQKALKPHILFLCTGNSCRSQIAEGWMRHLGNESIEVKSAGIKAHGINPRTIRVMKEAEIDILGQSSKVVTPEMMEWASLVITVCGDADESCPSLPTGTKKLHWPLPDPAKATGSDEEVMLQFRSVSEDIHQRIIGLLATLK